MTLHCMGEPRGTASAAAADGLPVPQRYWAMLAIGTGITLSVLDSAVANIALPTIASQLHVTPASAVWVVNAYQLAIVVALLPFASLGERIGYRRVYVAGLAVFTAGSLACALSSSLPGLVVSRLAQGLGGAGIMSVNGALVRFTYPQASLGRGVGLNALTVSIAAAVGPTVASSILAVASWPWLFAVNVPIGLVSLGLAWRALPRSELSKRSFDWMSAGLNVFMFGLFFIGADTFTHAQGSAWIAAAEVAGAMAAGAGLYRRQANADAPLIPIDLLRIPVFALSIITSIASFAAYALAFLALPFYFETVLHRSQVSTGLLMTPWPVALGLVAPLAGRLSDRVPAAVLGGFGLMVLAAGLTSLAFLPPQASTLDIAWRMALSGFGFGFFQAPNNRTLLSSAPRERSGAAGGMLATARLIGMTGGATLLTLIFRLAPNRAESIGLSTGAVFALVAAIVSLLRLTRPPNRSAGVTPTAEAPAGTS